MKTLALLLALSVSAAVARPGGYTANGGVYQFDPDRDLDYMTHARNAGKREKEEESGDNSACTVNVRT